MNETILQKEDLTADDFLKNLGETMLAAHQAEIERRNNVVRIGQARARRREQTIQKLLELARAAEEAAEQHAEIFRRREAMLKESARLEGKARGRWYETFLEFSRLSKSIDSDNQRVDDELRSRGAKIDAARENLAYLPASDAFQALVVSGEFAEKQPAKNSEDLQTMIDLFGQLRPARREHDDRNDYDNNEPPPKKAA